MTKLACHNRILVGAYGIILFLVCAPKSGSTQELTEIDPPGLIATIKGKNYGPKEYVRVEIRGPEYKKMATNKEGTIATTLAPGNYTIIVRERGRQMEFQLRVDEQKITRKTFVLAW